MTIRRILLPLATYPDAPQAPTLESAMFLAQALKAELTGVISQLSDDPKTWPSPRATWPVDVRGLIADAVLASGRNAQSLMAAVTALAATYGVELEQRRDIVPLYASPEALIDISRLHDLTILPTPETDGFDRRHIESIIFSTGRPTLLLPASRQLQKLGTIMVAWDYGRESARALADAMPILKLAGRVHIVSVFGEKGLNTHCTAADLDKYLSAHAIAYSIETPTMHQGSIGDFLAEQAQACGADMMVMGAFGHSRLREFVLGGATRSIMREPSLPIFMSH